MCEGGCSQTRRSDSVGTCVLRREVDGQYQERNEGGGQTDAGIGTTVKFAPRCSSWVPGLDPDEWCQSASAFTGCVLVETQRHMSSVFGGSDVLFGYRAMASLSANATVSSTSTTVSSCQDGCHARVDCGTWWFNGTTCWFYGASVWSTGLEVGGVSDVVGTTFGGSGGYLVPNVHAGPTFEARPVVLGSTFMLESVDFFVADAAFEPPSSGGGGGGGGNETAATNETVVGTFRYYGTATGDDDDVDVRVLDGDFGNMTTTATVVGRLLTRAEKASIPAFSQLSPSASIYRLTFSTPLHVLGNPLTPTFSGGRFSAPSHLRIVFRGADGALEWPTVDGSPLVPMRFNTRQNGGDGGGGGGGARAVMVPRATRARSCVPLTIRQRVVASDLGDLTRADTVRREDPVDCAVLSSDGTNVDAAVFSPGNCCDESGGDLSWPTSTGSAVPAPFSETADLKSQCAARTDVGLYSNMRTFSRWFWALSWSAAPERQGEVLMMSASADTTVTTIGPPVMSGGGGGGPVDGVNDDVSVDATTPVLSQGIDAALGTLPTCTLAGDPASCAIALDVTGDVPCTGAETSVWFQCMHPMMTVLFPEYLPSASSEPSTPFQRPMALFTTVANVEDLLAAGVDQTNASAAWPVFRWTQYATMVHYCATFLYDPVTAQPDSPESGWVSSGKFMACKNDPLTYDDRLNMCRSVKPWWVIEGSLLYTLSFEDLCPFASGGDVDRYCVVFSDHPQYSTVRALLGARLPDGESWTGVTFYYAPFTMQAMRHVVMSPSVINTLFTNSADAGVDVDSPLAGKPIPLTSSNVGSFSDSVRLFARELVQLEDQATLEPLCDDDAAIPLSAFRAMYTVIQGYYDATSDTYTMPSTNVATPSDRVVLAASAVQPVFREINTLLDYDNVAVKSLVPGVSVTVGHAANVVVNSITICTRFQVDGVNVEITDLTLDQSNCDLVDVLRQTPIVFSGDAGTGSDIHDIVVIESAAAVAVLGGDDLNFRPFGTTNADSMLIYDVTFQYGASSTVPKDVRNTVAVFGRASGVPVVTACRDSTSSLANCFVETSWGTGNATASDCGAPNACAGINGCCGRPTVFPVPDYTCDYGLRCSNSVLRAQPNSRALCNAERCGCNTRYHDPSDTCTTLVSETSTSDCPFNIEQCHVECTDGEQFWEVDDLEIAYTTRLLHQNWQYTASTEGRWYAVQPFLNGGVWQDSVRGIGYGQLVWTVRSETGATPTTPRDLNVEAHLLPITGSESAVVSDPLSVVTVVPRADCTGSGCQIYESTVKLQLDSDWFFSRPTAVDTLYTEEFLTALGDNGGTQWCVGVNTSTNNIEVDVCGTAGFLDDWFYDSITTRIHVANHPYMCPTLMALSNSTTAPYDAARIRDGDLDIAYSDTGGNLVWLPCAPCTIGAERVLLPEELDTPSKTQLLQVEDGVLYGGDGLNSTLTTLNSEGVWAIAHSVDGGNGSWIGFLMAANFSCGTLEDRTRFTWEPCRPEWMLSRTPTLCQTRPEDFIMGVFQYVCTQGSAADSPVYL